MLVRTSGDRLFSRASSSATYTRLAPDDAPDVDGGESVPLRPRPDIYFGDGPFSAPSSDSEDDADADAEKAAPRTHRRSRSQVLERLGYVPDESEELVVGRPVRALRPRTPG